MHLADAVFKQFAKSLKVIRNDTLEYGACEIVSVNKGVTLKLGLDVIEGH